MSTLLRSEIGRQESETQKRADPFQLRFDALFYETVGYDFINLRSLKYNFCVLQLFKQHRTGRWAHEKNQCGFDDYCNSVLGIN